MATCDSDFSSDAPADFHLSSSTEDSCTRLSPTFEKCPLCSSQRKVFYCRQCIQNGDFVHSVRHYSTRYAEKHMQLIQRRKERREIEQRCRNILLKRLQVNKLQCEIFAYRERVRLLKLLIQETKENISIAESKVTNLQEANAHRSDRLPRYEERICKLERYVVQMGMDAEKRRANMHLLHEELKNVIRTNVHQLVQYIFPIAQAQPVTRVPPGVKSASPENEEESSGVAVWSGGMKAEGVTWHGLPVIRETETEPLDTVSALADATRTAYIRGHWVFTDSSGELQHCIVAPWLPDSGDYSAYNMWVAANKDGVPGAGGDFEVHNPAYNISAALTYTTQLVNILAFYLDVRLPTKLCYSDFCGHELKTPQFIRRVARLNSNVLHLCFSQNVNPNLLHPSHTLQNILHLLDTEVSDLGRQGPLEIDLLLTKFLEDQLTKDLECNEDSGSEDESDTLPYEWETVQSVACPESAPGVNTVALPQALTNTQHATSMAGGLVTSAAASIASFWRGWTGQK
ncbi:Uncharacterized protein GBIM_11196 [Gryllus bimaculatus]|nr:Uncharacterized protein GBIM_11196 [Gryllus bimaculatus]